MRAIVPLRAPALVALLLALPVQAAPPRKAPAVLKKPAPAPAKKVSTPIPREALAFPPLPTRAETDRSDRALNEVVAAGKGRIEYDSGFARAIGFGALPPLSRTRTRAQDTLAARDAALNDALRTLGMAVQQVKVTADTRVANYTLQSDEVRVKVAAVVRSAEVVEERLLPELGIYRMVVQTPLEGAGSVKEAVGVEAPPVNPYAPGAPPPAEARYTGLIVDCRGLDLSPIRAPKLFDTSRREVYGTMEISPEFVDEFGIVSYPTSMREARRPGARAGERPLIVRAVAIGDVGTGPVLSTRDARLVREASARDHFFERTAVAFLIDPL